MGRRLTKQYKQKQVNKSPPKEKTSDCNSKTNFTLYLCAIQLFIYLLGSLGLIDYTLLTCDSRKRYQIWRLFTVSLVHSELFHLLGNLITEVVVGGLLEKTSGSRCVALIFIAGNAVGEFMTCLFSADYEGEGASAGIMALLSAYVVHSILNPPRRSKWLLIFCFLAFVGDFFVITAPYYLKLLCDMDPHLCVLLYRMGILDFYINLNVGSASHYGGYVAGVLVGIQILKIDASCSKWTVIFQRISATISVFLFPFLIIYYFFA